MPIHFFDRIISYDTFIDDLARRIVRLMKLSDEPEFISQRQAYKMFGRRNVERWRHQGRVVCFKRPGKVEYRISDLRRLQNTEQDYMKFRPMGMDYAADSNEE